MNPIEYEPIPKEQRRWKYTLRRMIEEPTDILDQGFSQPLYSLSPDGVMRIFEGYSWDGMSGPGFDTKCSMRGSAVHDALYQAIRLGLLPSKYRREADYLFRKVNLGEGMHPIRAWWCWAGVRIFGGLWNRRASAPKE